MDSPLSDYLSEHHAFCRLLHDFCDRTRQFSRSEDSVQVRKELLQECLSCANLVSMEYPILEKAAGNAMEYLNGSDGLADDIAREIAGVPRQKAHEPGCQGHRLREAGLP